MCNATTKPQRSKLLWRIEKKSGAQKIFPLLNGKHSFRFPLCLISLYLLFQKALECGVGVPTYTYMSREKLSLKNGGKKLRRCLRYGEWRWGLRSSSLWWPHNAVVHVPTLHTVCVYPHYRKMWKIRMRVPCVPKYCGKL